MIFLGAYSSYMLGLLAAVLSTQCISHFRFSSRFRKVQPRTGFIAFEAEQWDKLKQSKIALKLIYLSPWGGIHQNVGNNLAGFRYLCQLTVKILSGF